MTAWCRSASQSTMLKIVLAINAVMFAVARGPEARARVALFKGTLILLALLFLRSAVRVLREASLALSAATAAR